MIQAVILKVKREGNVRILGTITITNILKLACDVARKAKNMKGRLYTCFQRVSMKMLCPLCQLMAEVCSLSNIS